MKKLGQIAIGLFVVNNTAFDLINIPESTHLSIIYFSIMYFSFMLICVDQFIKSNPEYLRLLMGMRSLQSILFFIKHNYINTFSLVMGIGFAVRIVWELNKWNLAWNDYMLSVNNYEKGLLISFLTIALILIPITNDRRKRNFRNDNT